MMSEVSQPRLRVGYSSVPYREAIKVMPVALAVRNRRSVLDMSAALRVYGPCRK